LRVLGGVRRGVEAHRRERGRSWVVRRSVAAHAGETADGGHGRHARVLEIRVGVVMFESVAVAAEENKKRREERRRVEVSFDEPRPRRNRHRQNI